MGKEITPPKNDFEKNLDALFDSVVVPDEGNSSFTQNLETNPDIQYIDPDLRDTDTGNVIRLLNKHRNDILYTKGLGFLVWNGKHWESDGEHLLHSMVASVHKEMLSEAAGIRDSKERKEFLSWVRKSNNQAGIKNVISYLKDSWEIRQVEEVFDQNDWLLNFQNGTLDLETGILREFRRSDYITKCLPYDYDPEAKCPRWEQFIKEVLQPEEVPWIQRVAGYSLTGDASAQMFMFLSGVGRNGKGILLQTLLKVLGSYGQSLPPGSIMQKYGDAGIPNDIAMIKGARLIVVPEVPSGKKWNEELLKQLTGEDEIKARFLKKEFFGFKCKGKLWISGNTQPTVTDSGISFWKRLKLLQFRQVFDNPDMTLGKRLNGEIPGILNWALEGLRQVVEMGVSEGVREPQSVADETLQYRSDNDSIGRFLDDCCEFHRDYSVKATALYSAYKDWVNEQGEAKEMLSLTKFGSRLKRLNYARQKQEKGMFYGGLKLKPSVQEMGSSVQELAENEVYPYEFSQDMTDTEFDLR